MNRAAPVYHGPIEDCPTCQGRGSVGAAAAGVALAGEAVMSKIAMPEVRRCETCGGDGIVERRPDGGLVRVF